MRHVQLARATALCDVPKDVLLMEQEQVSYAKRAKEELDKVAKFV